MRIYEEMKRLWEEDPEEFEKRRLEVIEQMITKAPKNKQLQLRQLQWEIDGICVRAKNPSQRLQYFQEFFMERVYGEEGSLMKISHCCKEIIFLTTGNARKKKGIALRVLK